MEQVLNSIALEGVERIYVLGDVVGYYYRPDLCLDLLKEWDHVIIQGNHEQMLFDSMDDPELADKFKKKYGSGLEAARSCLRPEQLLLLRTAAIHLRVEIENKEFALFHSSPLVRDGYVYPDEKQGVLLQCLSHTRNYLLMGHTHRPFLFSHAGKILVNTGSVGQLRSKGGYASWVLYSSGEFRTFMVEYNISSLLVDAQYRDPGLPYLREVLLRK